MQITGTSSIRSIPKMIKRSGLSFLLQPGPGPQIRSAEIRKKNSCTHVSATHPHGTPPLRHVHSIWVSPHLHLLATVEGGERGSIEHPEAGSSEIHNRALRDKPKKKKKNSPEKNPEEPPPFPKHTHINSLPVYTTAPLPPLRGLHRSAYVVTNDTFIFLQRVCVCKTAEVHQDVKYFGWATQVALEDNQMEV